MTVERFPAEFSSFLNARVWGGRRAATAIADDDAERLRWFPLPARPAAAAAGLALLEREMTPFLRPVRSPMDPAWITGMKKNYSEALPKTMRNWSVSLHEPRSAAAKAARGIGLVEMLGSASLHEFACAVSGFALEREPTMQLIRYVAGDYVGPHNDHHPENANLRDGYVDLQVTLTNEHVARQYLLYESGGTFNKLRNVGVASGVSVSMLPFWHQVTPLEAKPGHEAEAARWLLLASFDIQKKRK